MKRALFAFLGLLVLLLIFLPALLVGIRPRPAVPPTGYPLTVTVLRHDNGQTVELPLEEYVKGVVAAEMPAAFHPEALKAQAVLARTYVVRRLRIFGGPGVADGRADVSSDPAQGQGWLDQRALRQKWGLLGFYRYWGKISAAVDATTGQILTYQGEVAEGVYHSTCGGHTESAREVWGNDVPYLAGVPCEFCRQSPRYRTQVYVPLRTLAQAVPSSTDGAAPGGGRATPVLRLVQSTSTGRVRLLEVGGVTLKGTEARERLGLPSTWFSWQVEGDRVRFDVRGWGHGVGMCQYGADGQARQGRSYLEILQYYFPGTSVRLIFSE